MIPAESITAILAALNRALKHSTPRLRLSTEHLNQLASLLGNIQSPMQRLAAPIAQSSSIEEQLLKVIMPETSSPGTYVDIGAADPSQCSNTWFLYQRGWRGLLIEPNPMFWYRLIRYRPGDQLLPIALSNYQGLGCIRLCGPCSSMRPDWDINPHSESYTEVDTLANVLSLYPQIRDSCQLCSIDVEGMERPVIEGTNWTIFQPATLIIEYRKFSSSSLGIDLTAEWEPLILKQGYARVATTDLNHIYLKSQHVTETLTAQVASVLKLLKPTPEEYTAMALAYEQRIQREARQRNRDYET